VARRAASDGSDHLTYLLQVTELELLERERKAAERRLKAARLPSIKSLESFDFSARPSVNRVLDHGAALSQITAPPRPRAPDLVSLR
jgi:DNA replication protein DnaC